MSLPPGTTLFQALTLAFWRFQGLAVTTLFTAVLQAIEIRTRTELETRFRGRFRDKGTQPRQWELPFGRVVFALGKLWDRGGRRTVYPLKEAMEVPARGRAGALQDLLCRLRSSPESRVLAWRFLAPDPLLTRRLWLST